MGHHGTAAIGLGLNAEASETPALLGGRVEIQQPEGQGPPRPGLLLREDQQQIGARLETHPGQGGEHVVELPIAEAGGRLDQGHIGPAQNQLTARVGQQGAAEHQPAGLPKQFAVAAAQLPPTLRVQAQVPHERAVADVQAGAPRQTQQPLAQLIHATAPLEQPSQAQGIGPADVEAALPLQHRHRSGPGLEHASGQQRLQQGGLRRAGDVEQGSAMVDHQAGVRATAARAGAPARAAAGFPQGDRSAEAQVAELGYQRAARHASPDHGNGGTSWGRHPWSHTQ